MSKKQKLFYSTKSGTSLLVAIGLTTVIVLVSLGVTTVVVSSIRESANVTGANQAYYAAEGALEEGLLFNQKQGAGYTSTAPTPVPVNNPKSNYAIAGQVSKATQFSDGTYGIPSPGSGNAGDGCDSLNPDISDQFWYDNTLKKVVYSQPSANYVGPFSAQDNPCNWSKIKVGETVSIPLYVTKPDGTIANPTDLGLSSLKIRVRTACPNNEVFCQGADRYTLAYDSSTKDTYNLTNDTIMSWEIDGTNITGDKNYLFSPYASHGKSFCNDGFSAFFYARCESDNSEIYESQINGLEGSGNVVVDSTSDIGIDLANNGNLDYVSNFLTNDSGGTYNIGGSFRPTANDAINKPVLKLSVIHSLQAMAASTTTIPYLEYQIITNSTIEPTDTFQTITAEGFSGTFKQVLEVKNPQQSGILQYVIQQ